MGNERLLGRNAAIANMFTDSDQLKNYYRFIALNPHINLHDACNILLARPNATVCYPYEEWNELGRQVENDRYIEYKPEEQLSPEQQKIKHIVGAIVEEGTKKTTDGKWFNYFEDFKDEEQFVREYKHEIAQQLALREEVAEVGMDDNCIDTTFHLEYCPNYDWHADEEAEEQEENTDLANVLDQSELGGAKTRFRNNVEAIKLVNKLYAANRNPTEEEKKVLAKFVGWGGLSQAFDEKNESWNKEYAELKGLLSQED